MTFSETFLVFLVILVVFLGVKFGFQKSCLCKRNDKYEVWPTLRSLLTLLSLLRLFRLLSFRDARGSLLSMGQGGAGQEENFSGRDGAGREQKYAGQGGARSGQNGV